MRVILDTNVIISGLFWEGIPGEVLERCLREYILCFSGETIFELKETFSYPKFISHIENLSFTIEEFLARLTEGALVISRPLQKISVIKKHPADNKFLACAVSCQASFIVSGDKHLLKLKEFQGIPILTPKEFLKIVKK
ncbi:MAG: putative toxin-antitoxin system toxin component, PIN family [Parcubacteria group bacterium]|nr:putative toxin-antitoxin system toxin component, PIN family [Parcubacteria group bacterium]